MAEANSGLMIVAMVAVVAIVGMVMVVNNMGPAGMIASNVARETSGKILTQGHQTSCAYGVRHYDTITKKEWCDPFVAGDQGQIRGTQVFSSDDEVYPCPSGKAYYNTETGVYEGCVNLGDNVINQHSDNAAPYFVAVGNPGNCPRGVELCCPDGIGYYDRVTGKDIGCSPY